MYKLNSAIVVAGHAASQHLTPSVWQNFEIALPAIVLGVIVGFSVDRFIRPVALRQIVLWALVVMGLRLIFA